MSCLICKKMWDIFILVVSCRSFAKTTFKKSALKINQFYPCLKLQISQINFESSAVVGRYDGFRTNSFPYSFKNLESIISLKLKWPNGVVSFSARFCLTINELPCNFSSFRLTFCFDCAHL